MNGPLLRAAVLPCLLCLIAAGCGPTDYAKLGDSAFDQDQYAAAIENFEHVLAEDPDNLNALRKTGLSYVRLGRAEEAYPHLERAQEIDRGNSDLRFTVARLYLANGRVEDAERHARVIVEQQFDDPRSYQLLGAVEMEAGRLAEAEQTFRQIAQLAPRDHTGPYLVGLALAAQGRQAEARAEFEAALALDRAHYESAAELVKLARAEGGAGAALEEARRLLVQGSATGRLLTLTGTLHVERGETELAEVAFAHAAQADRGLLEPHVNLADLYRRTGRYDLALSAASDAVRTAPRNPLGMLHLAYVYQEMEDYEKARMSYEQALQVDPRSAIAANNLAWILSRQEQDPDRALVLAHQAFEAMPEDPNIMDTLGWIHHQAGRHDEAVALLEQSAARRPADAGVHYRLGMAYAGAGDTASARQALSRAASSSEDVPERAAAREALAALR
jgi:tetratricopeptide (TPR) repeat protein